VSFGSCFLSIIIIVVVIFDNDDKNRNDNDVDVNDNYNDDDQSVLFSPFTAEHQTGKYQASMSLTLPRRQLNQ